jgi:hypothetical protein
MFFDLLLAPVTAPVNGIAWIGNKILEHAGSDLDEKEVLQKQLLALQLAFDMGDIDEAEFEAQEDALLEAIEALSEPLDEDDDD